MSLDARTMLIAAGGAASLVLGLVLTRMAISIAPRIGFVDRPGGHKSHRAPMPYGGGTAIFLAAFVPMLISKGNTADFTGGDRGACAGTRR